jgi:hypothetical protein
MAEPKADQKTPEPKLDVESFDAITFINQMDKARRAVIDECRRNGLLPSDIDSLVRHAEILDEWKRMDCDLVARAKADFLRAHRPQIRDPHDMWPVVRPLHKTAVRHRTDPIRLAQYLAYSRRQAWQKDKFGPRIDLCGRPIQRPCMAPVIESPMSPEAIVMFYDHWQGRDVYLAAIDRDAFFVLYSVMFQRMGCDHDYYVRDAGRGLWYNKIITG